MGPRLGRIVSLRAQSGVSLILREATPYFSLFAFGARPDANGIGRCVWRSVATPTVSLIDVVTSELREVTGEKTLMVDAL
ncbi:hypothetical protein QQF64_001823 [Cirrhinus molitorella]|uniref:Uncharacterized protein n=1 Tax=Cirrhinus molitorella TaxID=172907 RepID=A0ABR3MNE4_9TELE